jgi:hypothetical protein
MPTFRQTLPPQGKHQGYDLRRTPANSPLQAIITCESLIVCDTHFWHGRTMPCERQVNEEGKTVDDSMCQACGQKQPFRTHAYVSAFNPKTHEHFLFECTGTAAKPLEEYQEANHTLRGCVLHASRPKGGPNSKVIIQTNCIDQRKNPLPNPPNIPMALAVIWRLPKTAIDLSLTEPGAPTVHTIPDVLKDVRTQEDDAEGPDLFEERRALITKGLLAAASANGNKRKTKESA